MIDPTIAILLSISLLLYNAKLYIYSIYAAKRMLCNTKNSTISKLRTAYQVNIRTFYQKSELYGFAWFKTIWINERLFVKKDAIYFAFFHEYYHMIHHHKAWILFMRFIFSLTPLLLTFISWYWWLFIFLGSATLVKRITDQFEKKANEYAEKLYQNEDARKKRKGNN